MATTKATLWEAAGVPAQHFYTNLFLIRAAFGGRDGINPEGYWQPGSDMHDSLENKLHALDLSGNDVKEEDDELDELDELYDEHCAEPGDDETTDVDSMKAGSARSEVRSRQLLEIFLDRVAEFASSRHGGQHIVSSAIEGISLSTEFEDDLSTGNENRHGCLHLTRNTAFSQEDKMYLGEKLPNHLRNLTAAYHSRDSKSVEQIEQTLWQEMCYFARDRILERYIPELIGAYAHVKKALTKLTIESRHGLVIQELGPLLTLCQHAWKQHDLLPRVVEAAHRLRSSKAISVAWLHVHPGSPLRKILTRLMFLGRVRAAFGIFCKACQEYPSLQSLKVVCHELLQPEPSRPNIEDLETCCHKLDGNLGKFTKTQVRKWHRDYLSAQNHVHCEIQLSFHVTSSKSFHQYIGGSKRPCFLCDQFLCALGIRTKSSHGGVYTRWALPRLKLAIGERFRISAFKMQRAIESLSQQVDRIRCRILTLGHRIERPPSPQSSAAMTESTWLHPSESRERQSAPDAVRHSVISAQKRRQQENFDRSCRTKPRESGPCDFCGQATSLSCGICDEGYVCDPRHKLEYHPRHANSCLPRKLIGGHTPTSCTMCGKQPAFPCRKCLSIAYCSASCFADDTALHIRVCLDYSMVYFSQPRPDNSFRLCIYLPDDSNEVSINWLPIKYHPSTEYDSPWQQLLEHELIPGSVEHRYLEADAVTGRHLDNIVVVAFKDRYLEDGSPLNQCIRSLAGATTHNWSGPFVLSRYYQRANNAPSFVEVVLNARLADLTAFVKYAKFYAAIVTRDRHATASDSGSRSEEVQDVVRINSDQHMELYGRNRFEDLSVSANPGVQSAYWFGARHSNMAEGLGIVLECIRELDMPDPQIDLRNHTDRVLSTYIGPLFQVIDPKSEFWGWFDPLDIHGTGFFGNYIIRRPDGGSISARFIENVCHFCKDMQKVFERAIDPTISNPISRDEAMAAINPANFQKAVQKYETGHDTWTDQTLAPWEVA